VWSCHYWAGLEGKYSYNLCNDHTVLVHRFGETIKTMSSIMIISDSCLEGLRLSLVGI
jgi:hypothetical protein